MKFYQLGFRYLQRKKGKTILLLIVLILVNSMILGTSMILRTTNESKQAMQEKTNSKIVAEITSKDSKITENEVNKIETLEDVSAINRIGRQDVFPASFAPVTLNTSTNEENLKIALLSYDDLEKDSPFSEMQYRLSSGDYIKHEKKGAVINANLANQNELKVGDTIELSTENGTKVSVQIIGIFKSAGNVEKDQPSETTAVNRIENQIFIDNSTYKELFKEGSFGGYHQEKEIINGVETWTGWTTNEFESLDIKDIEKLAKAKGIADYNITTVTTPVNPVNFKRIEDKDVDQNADVGGVSLIGNKDMKLDRNVLSGNLHIKEGRMITPEDKDMCVISEELAKQNNLKIGDKISFNDYHDTENSKVSEAEIVGIYQVDQKMSPLMQGDTYRSENVIFTDLRFPEKAEGETSPLYERAYFKVEDVEAYDEVKENLQKVDINWEQYDLIDNNGNSETMSSNFNDLAKVSEMMILVISVASFVILVLVFLFWLKNRVQEVGIFLSLGVPKFRIIGQIWSEAIMITVLSLMLSFAVAPAVSKVTANYLVSQQVQQMQEEEKNNEGKVSTEYVAPKQEVQSISVEVTPEMYLLDGVSVLVLITASVLVSGIVILKRNPKDILSEMS